VGVRVSHAKIDLSNGLLAEIDGVDPVAALIRVRFTQGIN
jgi:hypothetical protein